MHATGFCLELFHHIHCNSINLEGRWVDNETESVVVLLPEGLSPFHQE